MNDQERELWLLNDEGFYQWWKDSKLSMTKFLRDHRTEIDEYINAALNKGKINEA
ncbi:MAG: hypothetical protein V3V92_02600 [Candidatus Hydrothermarchaeales archaeon]